MISKLEATRAKLAKLEAADKARRQRETAGARDRKRKAEVRSAIVLMALLRTEAKSDQALAAMIERLVGRVKRPTDIEALRRAGWLPDAEEAPPPTAAAAVVQPQAAVSDDDWSAADRELFEQLAQALHGDLVGKAAYLFKKAVASRGWESTVKVARAVLVRCADAPAVALTMLRNQIEELEPPPPAEPKRPTRLLGLISKIGL